RSDNSQTAQKNKFRFDPKESQPELFASTSGSAPNDNSLSD
ncbi:2338_t:CDS:1, partial [Funneliformis geosporum]